MGQYFNLSFKQLPVLSDQRGKLQTPNPTLPITDTPSSYCGSDALELQCAAVFSLPLIPPMCQLGSVQSQGQPVGHTSTCIIDKPKNTIPLTCTKAYDTKTLHPENNKLDAHHWKASQTGSLSFLFTHTCAHGHTYNEDIQLNHFTVLYICIMVITSRLPGQSVMGENGCLKVYLTINRLLSSLCICSCQCLFVHTGLSWKHTAVAMVQAWFLEEKPRQGRTPKSSSRHQVKTRTNSTAMKPHTRVHVHNTFTSQ